MYWNNYNNYRKEHLNDLNVEISEYKYEKKYNLPIVGYYNNNTTEEKEMVHYSLIYSYRADAGITLNYYCYY